MQRRFYNELFIFAATKVATSKANNLKVIQNGKIITYDLGSSPASDITDTAESEDYLNNGAITINPNRPRPTKLVLGGAGGGSRLRLVHASSLRGQAKVGGGGIGHVVKTGYDGDVMLADDVTNADTNTADTNIIAANTVMPGL